MSDDPKITFITNTPDKFKQRVTLENIKNTYICEGLTPQELANRFFLPIESIEKFIADNKLDELRASHIKHGLALLQNVQLTQAEKLISLENSFKRMRILQLEKTLQDYMAYYSKFGHFYKVHPITSEILTDVNGIPMQIKIPNVSKEILELKESMNLSEGLKLLLSQIDDIINKPKDEETLERDVTSLESFGGLFKKRSSEES